MLNTECKQCHKKWHHTNAKYCTTCGKKLVDKPEFKSGDITTISTWELFGLIDGLKETYAPKIKMTSEQKEEFMEFVNSPDDNFENFWFCLGSGDSLYKNKISEEDLMRAWLHPELIEVEDD